MVKRGIITQQSKLCKAVLSGSICLFWLEVPLISLSSGSSNIMLKLVGSNNSRSRIDISISI